MKGTTRKRKETEWGKIREGDKPWETPNSGKQRVAEGEVGGKMEWLHEGHWGGHLMGWALGVILCADKLNLNKNF